MASRADPFTGDPGRNVKAPHTGISLYRGPFTAERNLESGRRLIYQEL
jgi:hypothetical protein